jgi:hypothetical protein
VFGHGIFIINGKEWESSRALLRPNSSEFKWEISIQFEIHISELISKIPRDGSTVDLQKLFFMLTLDTVTEFLFWLSTDTLGTSSEKVVMFAEAFTYATAKAGLQGRIGKLATIFPNKKYADAITFINEYFSSCVQKTVKLDKTALKEGNDEHEARSICVFETLGKDKLWREKDSR